MSAFNGLIEQVKNKAANQQKLRNDAQLDVAKLDEGTTDLINKRETDYWQAGRRAEEDVDNAAQAQQNLINSEANVTELGMQQPADFQNALNKRAQTSFDDSIGSLRANSGYQADEDKLRLGARSTEGAQVMADMENLKFKAEKQRQNFNRKIHLQEEQRRKAKRSGTIGKVMGAGGAVVGTMIGGA